jgi:adenylylsulfate kinase
VVLRGGAVSWAIWITRPPGSGASALARWAAARLAGTGRPVTVLTLDGVRGPVRPVPASGGDGEESVPRAMVWLAATLVEAGVPVIVDATADRREWRELARAVIDDFAEVQLAVGRAPGPGADLAYEPAADPELLIDTEVTPVSEAVARVCELARRLPAPPPPAPGRGWAMWVTGLPGSGKTTIVSRAAEVLDDRGVPVRVLEADAVLAAAGGSRLADIAAHRALVDAATLLSEAGLAVIVDATAPARVWRETARALIPRFAEVQLVCPPHLCAMRERVVRWRPMCPYGTPPRRADALDVAPIYEPALCPEVTLHTDAEDPWFAVAAVVGLARRLHSTPAEAPWTLTAAR